MKTLQDRSDNFVPILHLKKLKFCRVCWLAQGHPVRQKRSKSQTQFCEIPQPGLALCITKFSLARLSLSFLPCCSSLTRRIPPLCVSLVQRTRGGQGYWVPVGHPGCPVFPGAVESLEAPTVIWFTQNPRGWEWPRASKEAPKGQC